MSYNISSAAVGQTNLTVKAEAFNQGMQLAANRFEFFIWGLAVVYGLKIVLKLPPIQNRLDGYVADAADTVDFGADVLGFFIVVVFLFALTGKPILNT